MSFQISILKVLASYPDGRASLEALKSDLNILMTSGQDWTARMRRLAARAPDIDVFSQQLVLRNADGWQITPEGRLFLRDLETPVTAEPDYVMAQLVMTVPATISLKQTLPQPASSQTATSEALPAPAGNPQNGEARPPALLSVAATGRFLARSLPTPIIEFSQQDRSHAPLRLIGRKDRRKGKRNREAGQSLRII